ncbi:Importin subunit beta-1 [Camellia lanceoleosa]|uniref:Importin subunit beta-1 n=1 Tax=Camellia lanceoleosa TaxID=1840588 RepID=A0ACC0FZB6_9ERIC|nr:Importin subunit beta-1 [Camellia lanceoleosa]
MALEITQFLLSAQSADAKVRTEAEGNLRQFQEQNLPSFFLSLSVELSNNDKSIESRRLADLLLSTLGSSAPEARHTSSQVIAKIAAIEIPRKEWPELIGSLLVNMSQQDRPASLKQATLETLGYICEEISLQDLVQDEVKSVLTAVVQGMNVAQHSPEVRLAATRALYNALDFAQSNFENEMERNYIMKVICETAVAKEAKIRQIGDREAATYAFGSILEGPSVEKLAPMVHAGLDFRLNAMKDENSHVKDTTAWTLSRVLELLHTPSTGFSVISPANLQRVLGVLLESIKDAPLVAEKVCGAIYYLAQGYEDAGTSSSLLTPYLPDIITCLIATAERTDGGDSKLRSAAYETLNEVVRCSNLTETSHIITQLLPVIMNKLGQTVELQIVSSVDREKQGDLQALLCGVLQVIIQKLSSTDETKAVILQASDQIMVLFLKVFACCSSTVHEEAMLAIGALAYATGPEFGKYMSEFYKYLEMGLQNFEEYQVCAISVGVVGDIFRALDEKILPYCDGIMTHLLKDLSSSELHRSVKTPIFSCFGDIALAIGEHFEKYILYAIPMILGAAEICARMDNSDEEMVEYGNLLRRSIFEAYSGILQGFKNSKPDLMVPHAAHLLQFIELVCRERQREESVTKAAVAVLGDLADALGSNVKILLKDCSFCTEFLVECLQSNDEQLKETAMWTQGDDWTCFFCLWVKSVRVTKVEVMSPCVYCILLIKVSEIGKMFYYPLCMSQKLSC